VDDAQLRWLYRNCSALVAAAYEDFGLTPLEANAFGRPVAALRWGGYLDTVVEATNGVFFDRPTVESLGEALDRLEATSWDRGVLTAHAASFGEDRFVARLRELAGEPVTC
jgi:glycosyltransferase involved in cell wall biosynthesis